jgi:hypothetical protein
MTPDQIYAIKRVLMLPPEDLAELRKNMQLHDDAITAIQRAFANHSTNSHALDKMTHIHDQLTHRG